AYRPDLLALKDSNDSAPSAPRPWGETIRAIVMWGLIWAIPMAVVFITLGPDHVLWRIGGFFSQLAVVTFGGAYAVLAYMAQEAVQGYGWLSAGEMADGLGLAETTPGPLIMVTQYVGFLAAFRAPAPFSPLLAGVLGAVLTTWVTFAPCFLWIFALAPWIERLEHAKHLKGGLAALTAAVVGVIANLSLWFFIHVLFAKVGETHLGPLRVYLPDWRSFDWRAGALATLSAILIFRFNLNVIKVLGAAAAGGLLLSTPVFGAAPTTYSPQDAAAPLHVERKIVLPGVKGRIDHLAVDPGHRLLFVAEYGNGTVDVVDLTAGKVIDRIAGLHEPQGVVVADNELVVACGDGTVHFYSAVDRHPVAQLALGDDADNVRVDQRNGHVIVGYGSGALAVIDLATHRAISRTPLPGHPEGFRLIGERALVNVPDRGSIISANLDTGKIEATWPTGGHRLNFPLAIEPGRNWFAVAYRLPAALQLRDVGGGAVRSTVSACGDADDLFIDRDRLLLVCGAGHVDVLSTTNPANAPMRVTTASGARTGLFVPEIGTLFIAVPARSGQAAIWAMRAD
ncbi:MAG: chromate transporter, partial [Sphingomonadales bacterium]|nr:chromate transporter [Sphingomonadales bacterium]